MGCKLSGGGIGIRFFEGQDFHGISLECLII
jgi:hypothetical protein